MPTVSDRAGLATGPGGQRVPEAVFEFFVRKLPDSRGFLVATAP